MEKTHPETPVNSIVLPSGEYNLGINVREYFSAMAMQAYASADFVANGGVPHSDIAKWAIDMADALIEELNKQ